MTAISKLSNTIILASEKVKNNRVAAKLCLSPVPYSGQASSDPREEKVNAVENPFIS